MTSLVKVMVAFLVAEALGARLRSKAGSMDKDTSSDSMTETSGASTEAASSLAEVIELLAQMLHDFDTQAEEDGKNWEAYLKWSEGTEEEKNNFVQEQEALVMATEAKKSANEQQVAKLGEDILQLTSDIASTKQSLQELITMRKEEHKAFQEGLADLTKTIKAVTKATEILEGHYAANGAVLSEIRRRVQLALTMYGVRSPSATEENVEKLTSFLQGDTSFLQQEGPDFLNSDGSKYDNYEKQGGAGGVIGMLTDLRSQLETQKEALIAKENEAKRQYDSTKAAKEADLKNMIKTKAEKEAEKQGCEATIEECISTIASAKQEIVDAKAYLVELLEDRETFRKQYGHRVSMRAAERGATQAALDALQSVSAGAKSGVGEASLLQGGETSFLQVSSVSSAKIDRIVDRLYATKSPSLIQIADTIKHHNKGKHSHRHKHGHAQSEKQPGFMASEQQSFYDASGFGPVLKLLNDLIVRLEQEAAAETSQHEWCETEKENGVASQKEREKITGGLQGTIESQTTSIAQLKTEILFLESEIARVEEETRIAKEIRAQEKKVFEKAKADHEEVIKAIEFALEALSGQYGFIQLRSRRNFQSPFTEYQSGAGGAGSAMEMLQDLNEKYSAALQTLIADENKSQKEHDALVAKNEQFIAETTNDRNNKLGERRKLLNDLLNAKTDMKDNLIELHQVSKYLQDLRPSCDDIRSTFEERKKRREAEIAALKEALEVISDPSSMAG
jgi:chromosome segregation ATPase